METTDIAAIEPIEIGEESTCRKLAETLETNTLALNHYRIAPGEGLPGGLHTHMDQEELFVVLEGTATFEMLDREITVGEYEAIRFGPGEFQSGKNRSKTDVIVLAIGAPRETEDIRIPIRCPDCSHDSLRLDADRELTFLCPDCDAEHIPRNCPRCNDEDLRVTGGDKRANTVIRCSACGAEFDQPPLRD